MPAFVPPSPARPLIREIDWQDPADLFARLGDLPGICFLDSAAMGDPRSGASYIGLEPVEEFRLDRASLDECMAGLRRLIRPGPARESPLPFAGGLIGMLSYDSAARDMADVGPAGTAGIAPEFVARRYGIILGFDPEHQRAWAFIDGRAAAGALERIAALMSRTAVAPSPPRLLWREETPASAHRAQIETVLRYIAAGDIYQANVTTRFLAGRPSGFDPRRAYLALRARNPAPFGAYLDLGEDHHLLSASPERFIQCDAGGRIETRPIKGTMPRDADPERDRINGETLAASTKDRAENLMICDLLRNDLSQVAEAGSVTVSELAALEGFASVWHLVSAVRAQLAPGKDTIDLLAATCPGGSITGAPKKRAVEIIDEIETASRGPFYGIVFRLGDDGALDSSIIIRSVVATPEEVIAAAGGGIVADSDPAAEYAELRAKIDPILEALGDKA